MREKTRRRYFGRSNVAQALTTVQHLLEAAIAECAKESPLDAALKGVQQNVGRAMADWKIYQLEQKRIYTRLLQLQQDVSEVQLQVRGTPVTPEEKINKKSAKLKEAEANKGKEPADDRTKNTRRVNKGVGRQAGGRRENLATARGTRPS